MISDTSELPEGMLSCINGGLKWERNTKNDDVIDARGGQINVFGYSVTFDRDGKVSSITPPA